MARDKDPFSFSHGTVQFFQHHLLKRFFSFSFNCLFWVPLLRLWVYFWVLSSIAWLSLPVLSRITLSSAPCSESSWLGAGLRRLGERWGTSMAEVPSLSAQAFRWDLRATWVFTVTEFKIPGCGDTHGVFWALSRSCPSKAMRYYTFAVLSCWIWGQIIVISNYNNW